VTEPARPLGVVIVDDEAPARDLLREYLSGHPDVRVLAECANGFDAVKAAAELKPDVVFLDIRMPKLDGFETASLIDPSVAIVFVTAYDEHAVRAFEIHAVDYLLKPFGPERLAEALRRVRASDPARSPSPSDLARAARAPGEHLRRIAVRSGARIDVIPVEHVDYFEAQDDYVSVRFEGREVLKHERLAALAGALDPERFIRIHRSYIVNIDRVRKIEPYSKDGRLAVLSDGSTLPVSRSGYRRLRKLLGEVST
jgi:two-component system LytT family response regulator